MKDYDKSTMAMAIGRNLRISKKYSVEICSAIRGQPLGKAKRLLQDAINHVRPIKITRHTGDVGHKAGLGSARFMDNTTSGVLTVLESAEKNAVSKGLSVGDLSVLHVVANQAWSQWHHGRQRRRQWKHTTIELVLGSKDKKETSSKSKKTQEKVAKND